MSLAPVDIIFDSDEVDNGQLVTGTKDNPVFTLMPSIEDCVGVAVTYANIPFTYYVIDNTNNQFTVEYNAGAGNVGRVITLEPGSYNSVSIATQLKAKLLPQKFEVFVDSTNSKLVVYDIDSLYTSFRFVFNGTKPRALAKILGFSLSQSSVTTGIEVAATTNPFVDDADQILSVLNLQGAQVINLTGPSQMFLDSDFGSAIFGSVRNQAGNRGLLGFWPVNNNYQGIIEYINPNPEMIPMTSTNVGRLNLSLTIGNRTAYQSTATAPATAYLQLNGEPFQVGLRFWKKTSSGIENNDSLGNHSIGVTSSAGRVFNPRKISRNEINKK